MRSFKHWTPRYIKDRVALAAYQRRNPSVPWLTQAANNMLQTLLKPTDRMLEFGSGRSSVWFAERVGHITSVEHVEVWAQKVRLMLAERGLTNAELVFAPIEDDKAPKPEEPYVQVSDRFAPQSLDVVLVDGALRSRCIQAVLPKLKPGGFLIIDNVNWYLPSDTVSPASRSRDAGPVDEAWAEISRDLTPWRSIWTSGGVSDTAFYFKPVG